MYMPKNSGHEMGPANAIAWLRNLDSWLRSEARIISFYSNAGLSEKYWVGKCEVNCNYCTQSAGRSYDLQFLWPFLIFFKSSFWFSTHKSFCYTIKAFQCIDDRIYYTCKGFCKKSMTGHHLPDHFPLKPCNSIIWGHFKLISCTAMTKGILLNMLFEVTKML